MAVRKKAAGGVYLSELAATCMLAACERAREGVSEQKVRLIDRRRDGLMTKVRAAFPAGGLGAWDRMRAGVELAGVDELRLIDGWYIDDGHARADLVDGDVWLMWRHRPRHRLRRTLRRHADVEITGAR